MSEVKYFVVSYSEDGDFTLEVYNTKAEVVDAFELDADPEDYTTHPAATFKMMLDEFTPGHVLIKGRVVLPKKAEVVQRWTIE